MYLNLIEKLNVSTFFLMPPNVMQGVKTLKTVPFNHMEFILVLKKVYYNK